MKQLLLLLLLQITLCGLFASDPLPLYHVHSHNDYEQAHPLWDALGHGFTSVEADIYLVEGKLLVAHDIQNVRATNTLEKLYLDPLTTLAKAHGGRIYKDWPSETLLIDVKSDATTTYAALDKVLRKYKGMLTRFTDDSIETNAVTVIISGNRDRVAMLNQKIRYAAYDGRMADLDSGLPPAFIPLISDSWKTLFKWDGIGPLPREEKERLTAIVSRTHAQNRVLRLWATPDTLNGWKTLSEAGVDVINTDHLAELEAFLRGPKSDP